MARKWYRIVDCLCVLAILACCLYGLSVLLRPINTDGAVDTICSFHELPENSLEVIGLGSSHMWCNLDSMELYKAYGIGFFNYGGPWQHINTTALMLEDALKTQSPKLVLIETYKAHDVLLDSALTGELYYTRWVRGVPGKADYLHEILGDSLEGYASYLFPLRVFHGNWETLEERNFFQNATPVDHRKTMGYFPMEAVEEIDISTEKPEQSAFTPEALHWLDRIVALCEEHSADILFYTAPFGGGYKYGDAMAAYAEEHGYPYLNLFEHLEETGLDGSTDYADYGHMNVAGAAKTADYLGAYITERYELTDFRSMEGNLWEQLLPEEAE